jgi:hypothetical protein
MQPEVVTNKIRIAGTMLLYRFRTPGKDFFIDVFFILEFWVKID